MKLLVDTLTSEHEQIFSLTNDTRYILEEIKTYLYMHNSPAGTFTVTLYRNDVELASKSFTSADIKASLNTDNNYIHVFYPLDFGFTPLSKGTYKIKLTSSGYTFSESAYLAWIKEFESIYQEFSSAIPLVTDYPYSFRLIMNTNRELT